MSDGQVEWKIGGHCTKHSGLNADYRSEFRVELPLVPDIDLRSLRHCKRSVESEMDVSEKRQTGE